MEIFLQMVITGIAIGGIYALVALGFVLIYKSSQVLNFAQGQLLMGGAYVGWLMVMTLNIPFYIAFPLTMALSAVLGIIIERLALRPMIGEPIIAVIIVTLGLSSMLDGLILGVFGTEIRRIENALPEEPIFIAGAPIPMTYIYSFGIALVFVVLFTLFFRYTEMGIAMRAASDDQQAALSMGISVKTVFALSWAIAAGVAGAGGILLGNLAGVNYSLAGIGLTVFPVVILGGLDSIAGAIIGGLLIGVLENLSSAYIDPLVGGGIKYVFPFVVLVVILMLKPYGLFGRPIIERV